MRTLSISAPPPSFLDHLCRGGERRSLPTEAGHLGSPSTLPVPAPHFLALGGECRGPGVPADSAPFSLTPTWLDPVPTHRSRARPQSTPRLPPEGDRERVGVPQGRGGWGRSAHPDCRRIKPGPPQPAAWVRQPGSGAVCSLRPGGESTTGGLSPLPPSPASCSDPGSQQVSQPL